MQRFLRPPSNLFPLPLLMFAGVTIFLSSASRCRLSSNFLFLQAMRVHAPLFPAPHFSGVHLFPCEDESVKLVGPNEHVLTARSQQRRRTRTLIQSVFVWLRLTLVFQSPWCSAGMTSWWAWVPEIPKTEKWVHRKIVRKGFWCFCGWFTEDKVQTQLLNQVFSLHHGLSCIISFQSA